MKKMQRLHLCASISTLHTGANWNCDAWRNGGVVRTGAARRCGANRNCGARRNGGTGAARRCGTKVSLGRSSDYIPKLVATVQLWLSSEASLDLFLLFTKGLRAAQEISSSFLQESSFGGFVPHPSVPPLRDGSTCKILTNSWSSSSLPLTKATAFTINSGTSDSQLLTDLALEKYIGEHAIYPNNS